MKRIIVLYCIELCALKIILVLMYRKEKITLVKMKEFLVFLNKSCVDLFL